DAFFANRDSNLAHLPPSPTRRSSDLSLRRVAQHPPDGLADEELGLVEHRVGVATEAVPVAAALPERHQQGEERDPTDPEVVVGRSEEHTSELQSRENLVCRLLLEKKN